MDKSMIVVEVVYALADKQKLLRLQVPAGTTLREAALALGYVSAGDFDRWVDPASMVVPSR
jgi:putative ubiquitin-RnfH superfamily antitoxin RatB of RatAB toxin-antitoxin module